MNLVRHFVLAILLLSSLNAQINQRPPSAFFRSAASTNLPNVELPANLNDSITQPLQLIADPESKKDSGIPLYLINSSKKPVTLSTQDGDLYIKLETQEADGSWVRAQAHLFSGCGNSYISITLKPGFHLRIPGYQPKEGRPAKIRFKSQKNNLVSQVVDGLVLDQDIADAAIDQMSVQEIPHAIQQPFAYPHRMDPADLLRKFQHPDTLHKLLAALEMWKHYGEIPRIEIHSRELVRLLQEAAETEPKLKPILVKVTTVCDQPFHPKKSPKQLASHCFSKVTKLSRQEALPYWSALSYLCSTEKIPQNQQQWIYQEAKNREVSSYLFDQHAKVDELLTTEQLWNSLDTAEHVHYRYAVWTALARRGKEKEMIWRVTRNQGRDRATVLSILNRQTKTSGYRKISPEEEQLWLEEFKTNPVATAAMISWSGNRLRDRFHFVKPSLDQFIHEQLAKSEAANEDFEVQGGTSNQLNALMTLYDELPTVFDPKIWTRLAVFRGYSISNLSKSKQGKWVDVTEHIYTVRTRARKILAKHGHSLPPELPEKIIASEVPSKLLGK